MRIGELAERAGVTTRAIRHYERIGVLPAAGRSESGYRRYGEDALGPCPVCGSTNRGFLRLPVIVPIGGLTVDASPPDPEENFLFAIALRCDSCGNLMLFDSEAFRKDQPSLIRGLTEDEEDDLEARDPPP